jgi:hypothetical protein
MRINAPGMYQRSFNDDLKKVPYEDLPSVNRSGPTAQAREKVEAFLTAPERERRQPSPLLPHVRDELSKVKPTLVPRIPLDQ